MKVGDLVKYKWQRMWDKYSSPYGKSEWHERYDNYVGLIYHIDNTNCDLHLANVYVKFSDKTTVIKASEIEVVSVAEHDFN